MRNLAYEFRYLYFEVIIYKFKVMLCLFKVMLCEIEVMTSPILLPIKPNFLYTLLFSRICNRLSVCIGPPSLDRHSLHTVHTLLRLFFSLSFRPFLRLLLSSSHSQSNSCSSRLPLCIRYLRLFRRCKNYNYVCVLGIHMRHHKKQSERGRQRDTENKTIFCDHFY